MHSVRGQKQGSRHVQFLGSSGHAHRVSLLHKPIFTSTAHWILTRKADPIVTDEEVRMEKP